MITPSTPIASYRIMACRDTLAAGLYVRPAGLAADPADDHVDLQGLSGIQAMVYVAPPAIVVPMPAPTIADLHRDAMSRAWRAGAWDIKVSLHPPLEGAELGLVGAFADFSADPGLPEILLDAAGRGRLASWLWRPMLDGPEGRRRAHLAGDTTLAADGGRPGNPPDGLPAPNFGWRKYRDWTIRLGIAPGHATRPGPRPRPATVKQRGYLGRLLRLAGESGRLPARLSFDEATAWIDRLRTQT